MTQFSRRQALWTGALGLGFAGARGALVLAADAKPTSATADLHDYLKFVREYAPQHGAATNSSAPVTAAQILGPYHRPGAPFRGKVTPPLEPGRLLVVRGRVWGADTRQPLAGAVLDVWQANSDGHYDMSHPEYPLEEGVFIYRARVTADETGYYEYETVVPGRYEVAPGRYRPTHIHYWVRHPGYAEIITQLYFAGDPWIAKEPGIDPLLVKEPKVHTRGEGKFETCDFDVVLAKG